MTGLPWQLSVSIKCMRDQLMPEKSTRVNKAKTKAVRYVQRVLFARFKNT